MSVEAKIKQLLEGTGQRSGVNEGSSAGDTSRPRQGDSKDAKFTSLQTEKPTPATSKDTSKSSVAATQGDGQTRPRQGSSDDESYEDLGYMETGKAASAKMGKDGSKSSKAGNNGDTSLVMQGSSKKATYSENTENDDEDLEDEEFEDEIDEETLDELSKKTLASYLDKSTTRLAGNAYDAGQGPNFAVHPKDREKVGKDVRRKMFNTMKGVQTIAKRMANEDVDYELDEEQLDELSKKTLGSYIKKASNDKADAAFDFGKRYHSGDTEKSERTEVKRQKGIARAVNKLTKENAELMGLELSEEELDELSKKTLGSYINKAITRKVNLSDEPRMSHPDNQQDQYRRKSNNHKGIKTAINKLTKEEIETLFGSDLTEEFQTKATEVFEAAVISRVNEEIVRLEEDYENSLNEEIENFQEALVEKIDSYLDYIVEQWIEDNQLAIERGLKLEVMESFMDGLKDLFQEHYVDVPDEEFDVMESLQAENEELKNRLNEEINKNIENADAVNEAKRLAVFDSVSEGMTDTEIDKFERLVEGIDFIDEESYARKLEVVKGRHFSESLTESNDMLPDTGNLQNGNNEMSLYAQAISRSVKNRAK